MNEATAAALERYEQRERELKAEEQREQLAEELRQAEIGERLALPTLLEARRREHKIPEVVFGQTALFDRILVWQCDKFGSETYGGGVIVKHQNVKDRQQDEAPRGVIISAGLHALDVMWGHGIELGHVVNFAHFAPARLYLDDVNDVNLVVLRDGDLLASEDVREMERTGVLRVELHELDDGRGGKKRQHVYFDTRTNEIRVPWAPQIDNQL